MRALVTGGAGFIGSTLVDRLLAEDYAVDVVDDLSAGNLTNLARARHDHPRQLTFHRLDIRSPDMVEVMRRRRPDVVYHLAVRSGGGAVTDPVADADTNIVGALQVIEGARMCKAGKVVFASAGTPLYGPVDGKDLPIKETHEQRPTSPFGVAKKAVFDYLWSYRELHSLEFTALALGNVYGPRQRGQSVAAGASAGPAQATAAGASAGPAQATAAGSPAELGHPPAPGGAVVGAAPEGPGGGAVVATFAERLMAGQACTIYGDGRQTRDFVFVDDVVDALARAAQRGSGLLFNIGTGTETSIGQLYGLVAAAVGVEREALAGPTPLGDVRRSCLDASRAEIHLGWKPWTPLVDGVVAVIEALADRSPG